MKARPPGVWRVGEVIADIYEVCQVFSSGGMGLVYRVHHRDWDIDLAVKAPRPEFLVEKRHRDAFAKECEAWIALGLHPHVATCFYVRSFEGLPRVFAEYIEGGSLRDWILNGKLYQGRQEAALARVIDVAIQFAWGLSHAHSRGFVHQDVKPGNVLMTADGSAKITDFGLARAIQDADGNADAVRDPRVSTGGMTPAYCSPEQARREPLTHRTDMWSWAASVLEMFVGGVAWKYGQAVRMFLENAGRKSELFRLEVPNVVFDLLLQCLEMKQERRPLDFGTIAGTLIESYQNLFGEEYDRMSPVPEEFAADALTNRAVSLLDLGQASTAIELLDKALRLDPLHPEATYNRGVLLLRRGKLSSTDLVARLNASARSDSANWVPQFLLGQVLLESGDCASADAAFDHAARIALDEHDIEFLNSRRAELLRNSGRARQGVRASLALTFPRNGAEHAHNLRKLKSYLEKGRDALEREDLERAQLYLDRISELPRMSRHPKAREFAQRLSARSTTDGE